MLFSAAPQAVPRTSTVGAGSSTTTESAAPSFAGCLVAEVPAASSTAFGGEKADMVLQRDRIRLGRYHTLSQNGYGFYRMYVSSNHILFVWGLVRL